MNPFRTLESWLGRPTPKPGKKTPPRRARFALACEPLEDRLTPTAAVTTSKDLAYFTPVGSGNQPTTGTELLAQIRSTSPLQDLGNVVGYLGLSSSVDVSQSQVVFAAAGTALLSVALTGPAAAQPVTQQLSATGIFDWVSPDYVYTPAAQAGPDLREFVPNDPQFPAQYYDQIIQTPTAWDRTTGQPGVTVAVLDDGVDVTHPDLKANVVGGWDFVHNTNNVMPDAAGDTHGTEVAGLIAAGINNGAGVAGVAGGATIMPLKVIGDGPTTSLMLARAVGFAVQNGAKIINDSLNIDTFATDPVFQAAVAFAYNRGLLWVNSAGNLNIVNPARQSLDQMLIVAATDRNDVKTAYSNSGTGIDLAAPGGTPDDGLVTTEPGGGYGPAYGTSMSAALVSGTAALVWSAFPNDTRDQVAAAVLATTDPIAAKNPGYETLLGAGRLDAGNAVSGAPFVTRLGPLLGLPADGQQAPQNLNTFSLRLVSNLDPATVIPSNFELRWAGPDGKFGTADDALIPLTINGGRPYQYGTNQLDFTIGAALSPGLYRFTAKSGGLADPFGRPVDGDGDGQAGGDLVRVFGVDSQVQGVVYEDVQNSGFHAPSDPGVAGSTVFADVNGNGVFDRATFTAQQPPVAIPDGDPTGAAMSVVASGLTGPACDVSVSVLVNHPVLSELTVTLVAPDGRQIVLFRNRQLAGSVGQGPSLLEFEDGVPESTNLSPTLASYKLSAGGGLAQLNGMNPNGTWRVVVAVTTPGDTGALIGAYVNVAEEPCATTDASGAFSLSGLPVGTATPLYVIAPSGYVRSAGGGSVPVDPAQLGGQPVAIGLVRQGAVYGRVLQDSGSGQFDPAAPGVAGMTVYIDQNGNGAPDPGEPSAVTDAGGNFAIPGLAPGQYTVRLAARPGYPPVSPTTLTAVLTPAAPTATGNDFLVGRNTGPVGVTVPPVTPAVRNTSVESVPITLSEPVPAFGLADLTLTRDGQPVSLAGATLIGSGVNYTLIGLGRLTAADGAYTLTVAVPAPAGDPARQPAPVAVTWTTNTAAPTATLTVTQTTAGTVAGVHFSEPVTGVTPASFILTLNGVVVPLDGVGVTGSGADYQLVNLGPLTAAPGTYVLELVDGGAGDAAGNPVAGTFTTWQVTDSGSSTPPPRPGQRTAVGVGAGHSPLVNVYDTVTGKVLFSILPYEASFTGGVRVATGDVNGDGVDDIITAPGPGGGSRIRVFDGRDGLPLGDLTAFEDGFTGGAYVTAGVFGGKTLIIVTPDQGGGPRVRVFDEQTLAPVADFYGIDDPNFRGGARAAVGDLNGDGTPDLIVSAGFGGGPRVAGFDGTTITSGTPVRLFNDFFAFEDSLRNGAYIAVGDVDGDGFGDVIVGGGPTGGPRVLILSGRALVQAGQLTPLADFFAGDPNGRGGVRVAVKDLDGDGKADVLTADGDGQGATVRSYPGATLLGTADPPFTEFAAFTSFDGGVFVG